MRHFDRTIRSGAEAGQLFVRAHISFVDIKETTEGVTWTTECRVGAERTGIVATCLDDAVALDKRLR